MAVVVEGEIRTVYPPFSGLTKNKRLYIVLPRGLEIKDTTAELNKRIKGLRTLRLKAK